MEILRLKELLKEKGITGKEISIKLGITENALSMIINGKRQPRFELLLHISEILEVDLRDLFVSTKQVPSETIYALRDNVYVAIGVLKKI